MSQARGPGSPPKPPPPPIPSKPGTPPAPAVGSKGVAVPRVSPAVSPARAGKTTMLGVQAPRAAMPSTAGGAYEDRDSEPTRVEERPTAPTPKVAERPRAASSPDVAPPTPPVSTPRMDEKPAAVRHGPPPLPSDPTPPPPVASSPVVAPPPAAPSAPAVVAPPVAVAAPIAVAPPAAVAPPIAVAPPVAVPSSAAQVAPVGGSALTAADVRLIVRTLMEEALLPLQRAIVESQQRIAEIERRPASAVPTVVVASAAQPQQPQQTQPLHQAPYASAIAAPVRSVVASYADIAPPAPLLDVRAIERDVPLDFDNPFDGRRKRKVVVLMVVALLAVFGGLFALLAQSYASHH
jgi:hypothetical protein